MPAPQGETERLPRAVHTAHRQVCATLSPVRSTPSCRCSAWAP